MNTKENKITIYTSETCPYCKQIKEELNKKNIEFIEKITDQHSNEWQNVINLTGVAIMPTINYKEEYFIPSRDYQNPQQLINLLESPEISLYSESRKTLERIKTLNYNINIAFGRIDQLLRQIENKINTDEHKSTN